MEEKKTPEERGGIERICKNCKYWDQTLTFHVRGHRMRECKRMGVLSDGYLHDCLVDRPPLWGWETKREMIGIITDEGFGCVHFKV